jgi:hypothetical protein
MKIMGLAGLWREVKGLVSLGVTRSRDPRIPESRVSFSDSCNGASARRGISGRTHNERNAMTEITPGRNDFAVGLGVVSLILMTVV